MKSIVYYFSEMSVVRLLYFCVHTSLYRANKDGIIKLTTFSYFFHATGCLVIFIIIHWFNAY